MTGVQTCALPIWVGSETELPCLHRIIVEAIVKEPQVPPITSSIAPNNRRQLKKSPETPEHLNWHGPLPQLRPDEVRFPWHCKSEMFSASFLFASLVWGSVGVGYFIYGKKQQSLSPMVGGILMIIASYFIGSALLMSLVCIVVIVAVYGLLKRGY